ncbi:MAG: formylglycine-generating enzyme family protein [Polyangiaceae bacterium]|nr:formylglycine-generating enzyme family protein [Polyangiaceae bacterium]
MTARHPLAGGLPEPWAVEWGGDFYGPSMSFSVGDVVQRMRWVPAGKFWMGSPEGEAGRFDNEKLHLVVLRQGFWLADTPCTQALWQAVMGNNPSKYKTPDRPVESVSWDDCQAFFRELNRRVRGLLARLPTEAEWEHACRGGTTTATWVGDLHFRGEKEAPLLNDIAWYRGNSKDPHTKADTRPVGRKLPNPLGLFDMLGNVYEWCEDWYGPYDDVPGIDPYGPRKGSLRVLRGGSWFSYARLVRAARRLAYAPGFRLASLGFRVARGPVHRADP